jgi:ABC-type Fe3+/spermidine/putrescine transport system ATPase subunit
MGRDLRLENLTKQYGKLTAVNHVNLEIKEGEFICFLGPSGCGKTTVLRMITGFETVTEGSIIFDNGSSTISSPRRESSASFSSPMPFSPT